MLLYYLRICFKKFENAEKSEHSDKFLFAFQQQISEWVTDIAWLNN